MLDLCCGTGLLAGELIARGYRVVGVDASDEMLAVARARLGVQGALIRGTLPRLTVDGVFDAAVCTFDGFNYLTLGRIATDDCSCVQVASPRGLVRLRPAHRRDDGFHVANPVVAGESAGNDFVISSVVDRNARTCHTKIEVMRPRDGDPFSSGTCSSSTRTRMCVRCSWTAGFAVIAVTDEYTHVPADASTLRATWTARRLPI